MIEGQPDMAVAGEASDGVDGLDAFLRLSPDVTVTDVNLPRLNGIGLVAEIRRRNPEARTIVITALDPNGFVAEAFAAGARSFLKKSMLRRELLPAIRAVHRGAEYIPAEIARKLRRHP